MLSFETIHLLTGRLLEAERDADKAGWSAAPNLLCLHHEPTPAADNTEPGERNIYSTAVPLPGPPYLDTYHHSLPAVLAAMITAHHHAATDWARARYTEPDARLLAWALLYIDNTDGSGPIRVVNAADVDGRRYVLTRRQGEPHAIVELTDEPGPQTPVTHTALASLAEATAATPDTASPGEARFPNAEADAGPDRHAELTRLLLDCWIKFHPGQQQPPDGWHVETVNAITEHIQRVTAQAADDLAAATLHTAHTQAALDNTQARFRAQIISAIAEDQLDLELGTGILDACGLEPARRRYTVWVKVPFQVSVTGADDDDAFDAAVDHLETTLRPDDRIDANWTDCDLSRAEPGDIDPDEY